MSVISQAITLVSAATVLAFAGSASAGPNVTADFDYSSSAPVIDTYARFEETARAACKLDRIKAGGIAMKRKMEDRCAADLVAKAVAETRIPALMAYHDRKTGKTPALPQYAEVR